MIKIKIKHIRYLKKKYIPKTKSKKANKRKRMIKYKKMMNIQFPIAVTKLPFQSRNHQAARLLAETCPMLVRSQK